MDRAHSSPPLPTPPAATTPPLTPPAPTSPPAAAPAPYHALETALRSALDETSPTPLSASSKVTLALEVLKARQLELDLAAARHNLRSMLLAGELNGGADAADPAADGVRTVRGIVSAAAVAGMPVGVVVDVEEVVVEVEGGERDDEVAAAAGGSVFVRMELGEFGEVPADGAVDGAAAAAAAGGGFDETGANG